MKTKITLFLTSALLIFVQASPSLAADKVYSLILNYNKGVVTQKSISVIPGMAPDRRIQPQDGYRLKLVSFSEKILDSFLFEIPLTLRLDDINPETGAFIGETKTLEETEFLLRVPYSDYGKEIKIYNPDGEEILALDVGHFGYDTAKAEEEKTAADAVAEKSKEAGKTIFYYAAAGAGFLLIIGAGIIYYRKQKSYGQKP